jgi:uncharacterized glyoxalase superfamily protein PhnB
MDPRGHNFHDLQPVIAVADVGATLAQYRDALGFKVDFCHGEPPVYARVSRDKVMLNFCLSDKEHPPGSVYWYFIGLGHVDGAANMDELYQEYVAKGVKVTMPPTVQPYGLREFEIEMPAGVRIRFHVDA